ncbi:MAG: ABC transporter substrate-binding protein [Pseudomonadota bacterium]
MTAIAENARHIARTTTLALMVGVGAMTAAQAMTLTDIAGRTVEVPDSPKAVILGEGRMMYAIAALQPDAPFEAVLGWKDDMILYDPDAFRRFKTAFPEETARLINFGNPYAGDFSVEKAVAEGADVLILDLGNLYKAQESGVIDNLAKVGVSTVFIDFRVNATENTVPSLLILGKIFGEPDKALEFIDYYLAQMRKVTNVVQELPTDERPLVFLENAAGWQPDFCCNTFGSFNYGRLIELAGGRNWGSQKFEGYRSDVSLEALIADEPDVIIGTGANWAEYNPEVQAVLLGYEANEGEVSERLSALAERPGFKDMEAVRSKRFHTIYHQFYNSPYHFVALQALATWIHPDEFPDLDPQATLVELHEKFLPIDMGGQFWASLD